LCFDGDSAGIKAAIRSIDRVLPILRPGYSVNYIFLKEKKDPDELLHTLGPARFEEYLQHAKPLIEILWHKCKMNKNADTPEQKALIEKECIDEVNKIKNPQIKAYYLQEIQKRIYYTYGKGSLYKEKRNEKNNKTKVQEQKNNFIHKMPLTDLFIRKIVAAMICYPQIVEQYSERLSAFEMTSSPFYKILNEIILLQQEEDVYDSDILTEKLKLNYQHEIDSLWELKMYKAQNTKLPELKNEIDKGLKEIELKQLDNEIKQCLTLIQKEPQNQKKYEEKYRQLIIERNTLLINNDEA